MTWDSGGDQSRAKQVYQDFIAALDKFSSLNFAWNTESFSIMKQVSENTMALINLGFAGNMAALDKAEEKIPRLDSYKRGFGDSDCGCYCLSASLSRLKKKVRPLLGGLNGFHRHSAISTEFSHVRIPCLARLALNIGAGLSLRSGGARVGPASFALALCASFTCGPETSSESCLSLAFFCHWVC